ncbi:MAG TPA: RagB/SusD family nutrient uptake outer membrane protein [Pelobium sp.]
MKKYLYIFTIFSTLALAGCEKLLDKEPIDKLSIEDLFKDLSGTKTALAGAYNTLEKSELYHTNLMIFPDLLGGNLKYSKTVNIKFDDIYNLLQDAQTSSMNVTYIELYDHINNLNNIIKYAPLTQALETEKNGILAEAKCLRALAHFDLLRVYSKPYNSTADASHLGIAVNLTPRLVTEGSPSRATAKESYEAVITDLVTAIALFDNSVPPFSKGKPQTFFTKYSAKALLAKVYLYANNYDKAFETADDVIKNGGYSLLSNANYVASWASRNPSTESIFELALEPTFSATSLGSYYEASNSGTFRMFAATDDLLNIYSATDIRGKNSLFTSVNISGNNFYFTKKYAAGSINATPIKLLRLSEMYLIRAESAVEKTTPDFTQANQDLSTIIKRADPTAANANYTVKADLQNAILLERRKELAFEGNLLYDLLRKGKDLVRTDCTAATCNAQNNDYRLIMPLPAKTVDVNIKMKQNEGYQKQ